jgi:glyoxylase-like metal-dependent hydrolase (beta-lactamase superfamily II)
MHYEMDAVRATGSGRLSGLGRLIEGAASECSGQDAQAVAIVMTHGHFHHVGVLEKLADSGTPEFMPQIRSTYLNDTTSYPPSDSTAGGVSCHWLAQLFPRGPIDSSRWL